MLKKHHIAVAKGYAKNIAIVTAVVALPSVAMAADTDTTTTLIDIAAPVKDLKEVKGPIGSVGAATVGLRVVRRAWKMVASFI